MYPVSEVPVFSFQLLDPFDYTLIMDTPILFSRLWRHYYSEGRLRTHKSRVTVHSFI